MGRKKNNIFLDIDQTLIAAVPLEKEDVDDECYNFQKHKKKARLFKFENMDDYYIIFERPWLQELLDFLFDNFNVSIWTAASKDYALFIIENFIYKKKKPNRKLDYVFFSYHCDLSYSLTNNSKDLRLLWEHYKDKNYNSCNTFILDDYDEVKKTQPHNCISIHPFYFTKKNSHNDKVLINLIPYLEDLNKDGANKIGKISI
jgi:hypothetical protein